MERDSDNSENFIEQNKSFIEQSIKTALDERKLSQAQVSRDLYYSHSTINKYVRCAATPSEKWINYVHNDLGLAGLYDKYNF